MPLSESLTKLDVITIAGTILTIVALGIACWQSWEAKKLALDLKRIHASISTKYIGTFPDYLPEITRLVSQAANEVVIFCDFPAYGCISSPSAYFDLRQAIERKIHAGVRVKIFCYSANARSRIDSKFRDPTWVSKERSENPDFVRRLSMLLTQSGSGQDAQDISAQRLWEVLESQDKEVLDITFRGASITELEAHSSMFFWIRDGVEAMVSIAASSEISPEYGFSTSDPALLRAFFEVTNRQVTSSRRTAADPSKASTRATPT